MSDRIRIRLTDTPAAGHSDIEIRESGFVVAQDTWTDGTEVVIEAADATLEIVEGEQ